MVDRKTTCKKTISGRNSPTTFSRFLAPVQGYRVLMTKIRESLLTNQRKTVERQGEFDRCGEEDMRFIRKEYLLQKTTVYPREFLCFNLPE